MDNSKFERVRELIADLAYLNNLSGSKGWLWPLNFRKILIFLEQWLYVKNIDLKS